MELTKGNCAEIVKTELIESISQNVCPNNEYNIAWTVKGW